MRELTPDGLKGMLASTTSQVYLFALKINHSTLDQPYYIVQNNVDLQIDLPKEGVKTFTAAGFEFIMPYIEEDTLPLAELKLDNVSGFLIELLRTITDAPEFDIYVIRKDHLQNICQTEIGPLKYSLKNVNWNINTISGQLTLDYDYLNETCMKFRFTPEIAIGLFDLSYEGKGSFIRENG